MLSLKYIFFAFLLLNIVSLIALIFLSSQSHQNTCVIVGPNPEPSFLTTDDLNDEVADSFVMTNTIKDNVDKAPSYSTSDRVFNNILAKWNYRPYRLEIVIQDPEYYKDKTSDPFYQLGAFDIPEYYPTMLNKTKFNVIFDPNYCTKTDLYNLAHPENMFTKMSFYTDHLTRSLYTKEVMKPLGEVYKIFVTKKTKEELPIEGTTYQLASFSFHKYYRIGENFLCPTQMYNHIPGHEYLAFKDKVADQVIEYAKRYEDKPQCFNLDMFFPRTYRLANKEECTTFFNIINSEEYRKSLQQEPIQYIIKVGHLVHASMGVFLLDSDEETKLKSLYGPSGENCGNVTKSLLAQTYLKNPLLVNGDRKIDFRGYLLVSSVTPLIAYYHEGLARVSIHKYDKFSTDRKIHITNSHMTSKDVEIARQEGKTKEEIDAMYFNCDAWMYSTLQNYLLQTGKITDPNWLDNHFRPSIKKIYYHLLKMAEPHLLKLSNVFELYAVDMMIDDNLNVWFLECNTNPLIVATTEEKHELFMSMLNGMFEIQYAYYRSRMKRYMILLNEMYRLPEAKRIASSKKWKKKFKHASKNVLEPEFQISNTNSWVPLIDKNIQGADAYFGLIPEECVGE